MEGPCALWLPVGKISFTEFGFKMTGFWNGWWKIWKDFLQNTYKSRHCRQHAGETLGRRAAHRSNGSCSFQHILPRFAIHSLHRQLEGYLTLRIELLCAEFRNAWLKVTDRFTSHTTAHFAENRDAAVTRSVLVIVLRRQA